MANSIEALEQMKLDIEHITETYKEAKELYNQPVDPSKTAERMERYNTLPVTFMFNDKMWYLRVQYEEVDGVSKPKGKFTCDGSKAKVTNVYNLLGRVKTAIEDGIPKEDVKMSRKDLKKKAKETVDRFYDGNPEVLSALEDEIESGAYDEMSVEIRDPKTIFRNSIAAEQAGKQYGKQEV
jgi:hypothetical protein